VREKSRWREPKVDFSALPKRLKRGEDRPVRGKMGKGKKWRKRGGGGSAGRLSKMARNRVNPQLSLTQWRGLELEDKKGPGRSELGLGAKQHGGRSLREAS